MNGILIQYGCSLILSLICSMNAFVSVWSSYAIKMLESEQSPLGFKISENVASLVGSTPMLGSFIATLFAGSLADAIGRKKTQLLCGLFYAVAWSLLATARSTLQLLLARFIMGLSLGTSSVTAIIYTSEITDLSIRGSTATMASLLYNLGVMASYLEGWFCTYEVICYVNLTAVVIYVIMLIFLKETPTYLLRIGKEKEALKSLKFYRGESKTTEAILEEFNYLKIQVNRKDTDVEPAVLSEKEKLQLDEKQCGNEEKNKSGWVLLFTIPRNRRAITCSVTFVVLTNAMGMVAVQAYAREFFITAAPTLSPDMCSVIFSLILVLSNVLTVIVTDLFPRRVLMVSCSFLTTVCLVILGVIMRWPVMPSWVTIVTVLVYCLVYHIGTITIVFVQLSECYGPQVKSVAVALAFGFLYLASFIVLLFFNSSIKLIGIDGTFFAFAATGAFTTVLSYFWIQETRRVPLEQIEKIYDSGIMYRKINYTNQS